MTKQFTERIAMNSQSQTFDRAHLEENAFKSATMNSTTKALNAMAGKGQ
ncbi:hypothetical protein JW758_03110 [Candidatus Peregrinibacteria bacterium]|nr:hypothetical protein [Candidatus Peregrinibacteria bacterium]